MRLNVFYNGQFWVGVVESAVDGRLKAAHWIFGSDEPSDAEVYAFVLNHLPGPRSLSRVTARSEGSRASLAVGSVLS